MDIINKLKDLVPICNLSQESMTMLAERAVIHAHKEGDYVFNEGDRDNNAYYLLEGDIMLVSAQNTNIHVKSNTDGARYPLAQFQPRQYSATALTDVVVIKLNRQMLDGLLVANQDNISDTLSGVKVTEIESEKPDDWMTRILQSPLFLQLSADNIQRIFSAMDTINVKAGDVIITQGDQGDYYYIIQSGNCMVSMKPSPDADEITLAELSEGDAFGEEALIANIPRNASVTMLMDGMLMRLYKDSFHKLIRDPILNSVTLSEGKLLARKDAKWLDVRFPDEYSESSIQDSINVPLSLLRKRAKSLDKNICYIVYCDTGVRSAVGAFLLAQYGYKVCYLKRGVMGQIDSPLQETGKINPDKTDIHRDNESAKIHHLKHTDYEERIIAEDTDNTSKGRDELREEIKRVQLELETLREHFYELFKYKNEADQVANTKKDAAEKKLNFEREKIKVQTQEANNLIKQVSKMQDDLEQEKKLIHSEVEQHKNEQEVAIQDLQRELKKRLHEEEEKMQVFYAWKHEEICKIQKMKHDAENLFIEQRKHIRKESLKAEKLIEQVKQAKENAEQMKTIIDEKPTHNEQLSQYMQNKKEREKHQFDTDMSELNTKYRNIEGEIQKQNENLQTLIDETSKDMKKWHKELQENENSPVYMEMMKSRREIIERAKINAEKLKIIAKEHDQQLIKEIDVVLKDKL